MSLAALNARLARHDLETAEIDSAFATLMEGAASHQEIKTFLELTIPYMADPRWLAAGARAQRARMLRVKAPADAIDVCGTGGDGAQTLNISTAVAFVAAGAGAIVAKHGNRAMSSKSGAADVLEALGVNLTSEAATLERALREAGVAFLFAQNHHPAMRHVAQARREIGARTLFNLLGPLSNPAGVSRQLVGVFSSEYVEPVANALNQLGCARALVVHGQGGLDELSAADKKANDIAVLENGAVTRQHASVGASIDPDLIGASALDNATELRALLSGRGRSGHRAAVLVNAAAALYVAERAPSFTDAHGLAAQSIDSGAALLALEKLIDICRSAP